MEEIICPHCGKPNSPSNKFCDYCLGQLKQSDEQISEAEHSEIGIARDDLVVVRRIANPLTGVGIDLLFPQHFRLRIQVMRQFTPLEFGGESMHLLAARFLDLAV